MPAGHYTNTLYPLQDSAISVFAGSPFYLTGGTALSRGYYNHRYSDDLDFFVNDNADFPRLAERQIEKLRGIFPEIEIEYRSESYIRLFVAERRLKIELVNDVPAHTGSLVTHPTLGVIDSRENILANKVTALSDRALPKDIADLYVLLKDGLSIRRALLDASSKAAGIAPLYIAGILHDYDYFLLDTEIKWVEPVPSMEIKQFLMDVAMKIVVGAV